MNSTLCAALRTIGYFGLMVSIFYAIYLFSNDLSKMLGAAIILQSIVVLLILEAIASILENQNLIIDSLNKKNIAIVDTEKIPE
jgi:hypothetical protein